MKSEMERRAEITLGVELAHSFDVISELLQDQFIGMLCRFAKSEIALAEARAALRWDNENKLKLQANE